jgi:cell division protein FtsB
MAVAVARAPRQRAPVKRRRRQPRKAASTRRVAGGAVWIVLMGVLLAGVVALNVAVLRLNLRLDTLTQERAELRAENADLSSKLAVRASSPRTRTLAIRTLGVVEADTIYLQLSGR